MSMNLISSLKCALCFSHALISAGIFYFFMFYRYNRIFPLVRFDQLTENLILTIQIKRCGEMARRLRFFKEQMTKAGVSPSTRSAGDTESDMDNLEVVMYCAFFCQRIYNLLYHVINFLPGQVKLAELEAELQEINANNEKLQHTYSELLEYKLVLRKVWSTKVHCHILQC